MTPRSNLKILYTANELSNDDSSATFAAQENRMGQVDGVTRPRLAANEHPREIATIVSDRPGAEVLNHPSANADVAVQRVEALRSSAESSDTPAQQAADFQGRLGQVVRNHHTLASQLNQAMQALDRADQNCATAASTSAQHFAQQQAALAAAKAEAATLRESLERQLATVYVRAADAEAAAERLTRRETELAKAVEANQILERRFSAAVILLQEQDADREATARQLTQREAELADATEKALSLERQLVEAQRALGEAVRRSVDDRSTAIQEAAQRQSKFDALLKEEVAKYETLAKDLVATRQELARADTMFREAEARHALAMTTAAAQFSEQEARHEARIVEADSARDAVSWQLQEATAALESARQDHLANTMRAAEQFAQQEAKLREGSAARQFLEGQLAEANIALQAAEQRAAAERLGVIQRAAERDAEVAARLRQDAATRETLEQALTAANNKLAEAETAIRNAEQRHASQMTTVTARLADQQIQYETRLADAAAARDLVNRRLNEVEASFERSREEAAVDAAAAAERLAAHERQHVEALANLQTLEIQLADANAARHVAEQQIASERLAAERHAAQRQTDFEAAIALETAGRRTVQQDLATSQKKLADSESALRAAEQRHASAMTSAAAQFETAIARETADRQAVQQDLAASQKKVAATEAALRAAEQRHASAMTSALAQFAERRTELESQLSDAASAHAALEQARLQAEQRHASEMKAAAGQFAERQREFETLLAQTTAVRDANEVRFREAEATLVRIHDERAAEAIEVAEQRTQLQSKLATATEKLVTATANGETLERRLAEITKALRTAEQLVVSERAASAERASERQREFDASLSQELAARTTIEQSLAATRQDLQKTETALRDALAQHAREMTTASNELSAQRSEYTTRLAQASAAHAALEQKLVDADQRHAAALQTAATQLTEQQRQYEVRLAEVMTARANISQQLHDTETTLARLRQESDANAVASAERIRQRESELATAAAERQLLQAQLTDTETALKNTGAQALAERTAMQQQSAERQAEFDARLAREIDARSRETEARSIVEREFAEHRVAAEQTRQRLLDQSAALTTEMRQLEVRLTQELAREVADYEGQLEDLQTQLGALNVERDGLRECLVNSQSQLETLSRLHEDAKDNFERIRQAKEVELQRLGDDHAAVCQTLDQVRADALQTLERLKSEHSAELALIKALVAERDAHLNGLAARHRQQIDQLQSDLKAVTQNFEQTRRDRDKLQIEADRVPPLTNQLEASREESRRQFDGSPIGILRCSEAGELKDANRALIAVLGYRTVDELRALGSAASLFESTDDYRWFIENCETPSEIDWIWKKKDGSRLMMRLRAVRVSADVVDIVAENVTNLRAVEERLRRAQRLEAVGRLASEVADTCDILLRNVTREGSQWLATVASNTAQRQQGELILGDVTRAAGFLQQLSGYGATQTSVRAVVDVNTVLRDMGPVLKRVAGDDIELVLPKKASTLNVDVDADRVERILVNITAYGRERMPSSGGRLIFELARVVADPDFLLKYPNVRPGAHALISVTKVRTATPPGPSEGTAIGARSERPGIDLGLLQALIDDCGGHLWMKAEPGGDMELKIHLPLRSADPSRTAEVVRSVGRSVSSWFQS